MSIPNDPEELRRDRDRTREELGRTVAALTEKFDVTGRARASLRHGVESAQDTAALAVDRVTGTAARLGQTVQQRGAEAAEQTRQVMDKAPIPEAVASRGRRISAVVRGQPLPIAIALLVLAALLWFIVRRRTS
ncbi:MULTISPECIES: DUF3618 domain-containing protein [Nocardia]|uniref:DUF3618 domain-containing protein n=1 Tax=Nocardia arthritidis TaxID=228602 RepID=A0A6G9YDT7_9NOCA|nr:MULTISPECIES: DUF3618 domain-containing protein [Nocardia]QIS11391.1 DUF3618 domain-containing protein [Nocardia arthritidis]